MREASACRLRRRGHWQTTGEGDDDTRWGHGAGLGHSGSPVDVGGGAYRVAVLRAAL